jgi:hypothetical protein
MMELLGGLGYVESRFDIFAGSANLDTRLVRRLRQSTIGTEIILDAPDGTPM